MGRSKRNTFMVKYNQWSNITRHMHTERDSGVRSVQYQADLGNQMLH